MLNIKEIFKYKGSKKSVILTDNLQNVNTLMLAVNRIKIDFGLDVQIVAIYGELYKKDKEKISRKIPELYVYEKKEDVIQNLCRIFKRDDIGFVVDISGEPLLKWSDRIEISNFALSYGVYYIGSDFIFAPPNYPDLIDNKPSISVYGTGIGCGKTSVVLSLIKLFKDEELNPVVCTISRGGPHYARILNPENVNIDIYYLIKECSNGEYPIPNYLKISALTGVKTIGSNSVGSGLTGSPFYTLATDAAIMSNDLAGDIVIFLGGCNVVPPVNADKKIFVFDDENGVELFKSPFNLHKLEIADIVLISGLKSGSKRKKKLRELIKFIKDNYQEKTILLTGYDYKVSGDISEGRWLLVSSYDDDTNKKIKADLERRYSANIIDIYDNLQNSEVTGKDLEKIYTNNKPDGLIFELKGCGIKECASFAIDKGLDISFLYSVPESIKKGVSVEKEFKELFKYIEKKFVEKLN